MYKIDTGAYPADLATLTADANYFPEGSPSCPFGTAYSYSTSTYRVSDHSH
jgi:hypothetical protein